MINKPGSINMSFSVVRCVPVLNVSITLARNNGLTLHLGSNALKIWWRPCAEGREVCHLIVFERLESLRSRHAAVSAEKLAESATNRKQLSHHCHDHLLSDDDIILT